MGDDWFELSPKFSASKIGGSTHVLPWFRRKDSELERKFGASWPLNELHLVTTRVFAEHNEAFQRIHSDHDRWYSKSSDSPLRWRKPLYTCPWACRLWARNQNIWCTGQDMKMAAGKSKNYLLLFEVNHLREVARAWKRQLSFKWWISSPQWEHERYRYIRE